MIDLAPPWSVGGTSIRYSIVANTLDPPTFHYSIVTTPPHPATSQRGIIYTIMYSTLFPSLGLKYQLGTVTDTGHTLS